MAQYPNRSPSYRFHTMRCRYGLPLTNVSQDKMSAQINLGYQLMIGQQLQVIQNASIEKREFIHVVHRHYVARKRMIQTKVAA